MPYQFQDFKKKISALPTSHICEVLGIGPLQIHRLGMPTLHREAHNLELWPKALWRYPYVRTRMPVVLG